MGLGAMLYDLFFEFQTPHIVLVNNFRIGLIHRSVQLIIISYIIGVAIVYKKGYQETDTAHSVVTTKVKGKASTLDRDDLPLEYRRTWDPVDYVIPPQENSAFFVMTNAILTGPQRFGECLDGNRNASCNNESMECKITGWCPVEIDKLISNKPLLPQVYNSTVRIKNTVEFPKFDVKKTNMPDVTDNNYLNDCTKNIDPLCPVFTLGYIIEQAKADFSKLALEGGIININIEWDCNLDYSLDHCKPEFTFSEMYNKKNLATRGWNFRYANYYRDANETLTRDLIKAYGILFVFSIHGKAGKFSVVPLLLNIGAGLAFLGVATIICDFFLLYCGKRRKTYKEHKFLNVEGSSSCFRRKKRDFKKSSTDRQAVAEKANGAEPIAVAKNESVSDAIEEKIETVAL